MASRSAGYSGTPLVRKLGIRPGMTVQVIDAPLPYERIVDPLPADLRLVSRTTAATQWVHLFVHDAARQREAPCHCASGCRATPVDTVSSDGITARRH